jgi:hypothetical protein
MDVWAAIDVDEDEHLVPMQVKISNPFNIVPDQHDNPEKCLRVDFSNNIGATLGTASKGECNCSSLIEDSGKATTAKPSPLAP